MDVERPPRAPSARRTAVQAVLWVIFGVLVAGGISYTFLLSVL